MITSAMCTRKNSQTEVRDLNDLILVDHYLSLRYSLQPGTNIDNETYSPPGYRHVRYHACASIPNHWPFVTSFPYKYHQHRGILACEGKRETYPTSFLLCVGDVVLHVSSYVPILDPRENHARHISSRLVQT